MTSSADPDQKPTDLDLHCLLRQVVFSEKRVKDGHTFKNPRHLYVNTKNVIAVSNGNPHLK